MVEIASDVPYGVPGWAFRRGVAATMVDRSERPLAWRPKGGGLRMRRSISILLVVLLTLPALVTGCARPAGPPPAPKSPFTTEYGLDEKVIDSFVANDTIETAMCGGPFYNGAQPLPAQNTADFETARAKLVKTIAADAADLVAAAKDAQPAVAALRADYVAYLDALKVAEPSTVKFAGATLQPLVSNTVKQAVAHAEYDALASAESTGLAFTAALRDYLAVTKAVDIGELYLSDLNQIAGFAALGLEQHSKIQKAAAANKDLDAAMERDFEAAAKALDPVAAKLARVDAGMKRLSSADYYFSREAVGYMRSEVAKLKPLVDGLEPRDGMTAQDVADTKALYDGYAWWVAELEGIVESVEATDLVQAERPRVGLNPFGVESAYAAEGYTPGQEYGKALAVMDEAQASASEKKKGYLSMAWSGVKSAFGKVKTGAGVVIDSAGAAVQTVTSVGAGIYYGNSVKDIADNIKTAGKEVVDNYNNGVSGAKTFTTAGEYIEGVEKGAGDAVGGVVGDTLVWGANKAGASTYTQKTISSWSNWASGGLTKITVGMFTGMAKGIYKVSSTGSSTADVVSGIIDIGLGAIGGSKIILKASQVPGLTKGAYQGMKQLGQTMLNLGRSAANAAERKELEAAMRAALAAKGLGPTAVDKLISDSIKLEIAEQTAKALAATRGQLIKNMRDLISAGGGAWWADVKGTIASSWGDLVTKGFSRSMQGYLDAGTTVMGASVADYVENLIAAGLTDAWLADFMNQAIAVPPDAAQVDGTYKGSMIVTKISIPEGASKTAEDAKCRDYFKQLEGKSLPLTLKIDTGRGTVVMTGKDGDGSGTCTYSGGSITMRVAQQGSTITFTGTAKLRKEGGVEMSGQWSLPYQGTQIVMSGTWRAVKGD